MLYAVKIVARFLQGAVRTYKIEILRTVYNYDAVFVSNSLGYVSAQNWQTWWMTSDKVITDIKRATFFSETTVKF